MVSLKGPVPSILYFLFTTLIKHIVNFHCEIRRFAFCSIVISDLLFIYLLIYLFIYLKGPILSVKKLR